MNGLKEDFPPDDYSDAPGGKKILLFLNKNFSTHNIKFNS
jgi:hypothetical protein